LPELPDVEMIRRYVQATALHQPIRGVEVLAPTMLEGITPSRLGRRLKGQSIEAAERYGKYVFVGLSNGWWLVFHFGMTGDLRYFKDLSHHPSYEPFLIHFSSGSHLVYVSRRKLGMIALIEEPLAFVKWKRLGPDAWESEFTATHLRQWCEGKLRSLKSALLDQHFIAGIGNLYADEILFQAHLHPQAHVGQLRTGTLENVQKTIKRVMKIAIDRRADPAHMPRSWLLPVRGPGGHCPACRHTLSRATISGRTTYFCSTCQRKTT